MDYEYSDLVAQARDWANTVKDAGWISEIDLHDLLHYDGRTPQALFANAEARPLIVAFLGGTGVGKSTLLNRLAAKDIARTGVVRPTSKEVTLFHHESVQLNQLPRHLPIEKIRTASHLEENNKPIIWIDMPDFDSTEAANQQLVLEWLPHIDVLIYVVSPERYRDNKAWQLLLAEGGKHAWIFVLNQSDRGQPEQLEDFIQQLDKAGFANPIVYQTCCVTTQSDGQKDEFLQLQLMIQNMATENTIAQLEQRSTQVRKQELNALLTKALANLGAENSHKALQIVWQKNGLALERLLREAVVLPMQKMAKYYALHASDLSGSEKQQRARYMYHQELWDDWAQERYMDALDDLVIQADQLQLPTLPLKQLLLSVRKVAEKTVEEKTLLSVRKALINPGNVIQRAVIHFASFSEIVLPIASMGWVGYQVFIEFYESSLQAVPHYVGVDFAINSIMLIGISWLFPYFLKKKLQPSIEKAALKGLHRGFNQALQSLQQDVAEIINEYAQQQASLRHQAEEIMRACLQENPVVLSSDNKELDRMML